ncbi:glycoprotein 3-alpha-L-fucosyltransferase A-like [Mizuhopecten yessoensis]|nr:glycoprotein 3-alpha-L-fucosyltransferase A-like [Mizuhopecten yessoensis]
MYSKIKKPKFDKQHHSIYNMSFSKVRKHRNKDILNKTMLFWNPQPWLNDWIGKKWDTSDVFTKCPVSNCVVTKQRLYIKQADAVIFRAVRFLCQKKSKKGQIWIMFEHESPMKYQTLNNTCHRNLFNWTITYRRDSDFTFVHGQFSKTSSPFNESSIDRILKAKTKTAVGFISNCYTQSQREDYIKQLRKYGIDVDIYGRCGHHHCTSGNRFNAVWNITPRVNKTKDCFDVLDSKYKFYLSFENSLCDDYVTEKSLHLVLRHNIVPIIRDAANRTLFQPPTSYLDTKDFKNVKSLADRIKYLNKNFEEYKKYFHWKKHFYPETSSGVIKSILCDICYRLHNQHKYPRVYRNVFDFLQSRGSNSSTCHQPVDF